MFSAYSREMEEVVAEQFPGTHVNIEIVGSIGMLLDGLFSQLPCSITFCVPSIISLFFIFIFVLLMFVLVFVWISLTVR
jgi:hypothetical protein